MGIIGGVQRTGTNGLDNQVQERPQGERKDLDLFLQDRSMDFNSRLFFLAVLGFEFCDSHLLSKHSST
jgi:hypothetical protein